MKKSLLFDEANIYTAAFTTKKKHNIFEIFFIIKSGHNFVNFILSLIYKVNSHFRHIVYLF